MPRAEHATVALVTPASCAACRALPVEGLLSRHLFFSPSVVLSEVIDIKAGIPNVEGDDDLIEVDDVASLDDVFADSVSGFSHPMASTATVVPRQKPHRMADLFGEIMGEAAAIKGIPMPAPPLTPMSDDMQGECFRTVFLPAAYPVPPVQQFFTAAGGDPSTLKAPVKVFSDFTNVEGWADTRLPLQCFSVRAPDGITRSRCPLTASRSRLSA